MTTTTLEMPKNLQEARKVLRGLGVLENQLPRTLDKANAKIEELSGKQFVQPASGSVIARAREYLGPDHPAANRTDPLDMSARQLEEAIAAEKDARKRKDLFNELNEREAGKPTRSALERATKMTNEQLEQAITDERDPEVRGALFRQLLARESKR